MPFSFTPTQSGSLISTQQRTQPPWLDAMHQQGAGAAQNYFQNYQSNPNTTAGLNSMAGVAQNPNQYGYGNVLNQFRKTARGDYLYGGAGQDAYMQAAADQILPQVQSGFNMGGRLNSGLAPLNYAKELGNTYAGLYDNERGRQMQALNMAPEMAQFAQGPGQQQYQVGQLADNEAESNLDDYQRRLQGPGELYASESTEQPLFENDLNSLLGSLALGSSALFGNGGGGLFGNDGGGGGLIGAATSLYDQLFGGNEGIEVNPAAGGAGSDLASALPALSGPLANFFDAIQPGSEFSIDNSGPSPSVLTDFLSLLNSPPGPQAPLSLQTDDTLTGASGDLAISNDLTPGFNVANAWPDWLVGGASGTSAPTKVKLDNPYNNAATGAADFQNAINAGKTTTATFQGVQYEVPTETFNVAKNNPGAVGTMVGYNPATGQLANITEATWKPHIRGEELSAPVLAQTQKNIASRVNLSPSDVAVSNGGGGGVGPAAALGTAATTYGLGKEAWELASDAPTSVPTDGASVPGGPPTPGLWETIKEAFSPTPQGFPDPVNIGGATGPGGFEAGVGGGPFNPGDIFNVGQQAQLASGITGALPTLTGSLARAAAAELGAGLSGAGAAEAAAGFGAFGTAAPGAAPSIIGAAAGSAPAAAAAGAGGFTAGTAGSAGALSAGGANMALLPGLGLAAGFAAPLIGGYLGGQAKQDAERSAMAPLLTTISQSPVETLQGPNLPPTQGVRFRGLDGQQYFTNQQARNEPRIGEGRAVQAYNPQTGEYGYYSPRGWHTDPKVQYTFATGAVVQGSDAEKALQQSYADDRERLESLGLFAGN